MIREGCFAQELLVQYSHAWKMLNDLVAETTDREWTATAADYLHPARLALHITLAAEYYTDQNSPTRERYSGQWAEFHSDELPAKAEFTEYARKVQNGVGSWLLSRPLEEPEDRFPWAGTTRCAVSLFLLRHSLYHIGEMNAVLFRNRDGGIADPWMG